MNSHEELTAAAVLPVVTEAGSEQPLTTGGGAPALESHRPSPDAAPQMLRRVKLSENPEILLTAILDECHFLMRDVASESAIRAQTVQDRLAFVHTALACARTGASVGKSIAQLQGTQMTEARQDAIFNDAHALADRLEAKQTESEKQ